MTDVSFFMKCLIGVTAFMFCITMPFLVKRRMMNHLYDTKHFLAYTLDDSCFDESDWIEDNTDNPRIFIMHPVTPEQVTDQDLRQAEENVETLIIIR